MSRTPFRKIEGNTKRIFERELPYIRFNDLFANDKKRNVKYLRVENLTRGVQPCFLFLFFFLSRHQSTAEKGTTNRITNLYVHQYFRIIQEYITLPTVVLG